MQQDRFHFRFCNAVFASWDFHLTDWQAAANLRLSLRQQLKEMLNDADAADAQAARPSALRSIGRKVPQPRCYHVHTGLLAAVAPHYVCNQEI